MRLDIVLGIIGSVDDDYTCQCGADHTRGVVGPYLVVEREEGLLVTTENQARHNS